MTGAAGCWSRGVPQPQDTAAATAYPVICVAAPPVHKTEHYGDALFLDEQPRLVDLVPVRPIFFALSLVAGLASIAVLEALYVWAPENMGTAAGRIAMLDLGGKGSLAGWFSSLVLLAASGVALVIYSVRQHRVDDYRGRYRIWLWAAASSFLAATDLSASLHDAFRELMHRETGSLLMGDGSIWWILIYSLLMGWVGVKLAIDLWPCRLAATSLGLAVGCYAAAALVHLAWPSLHDAVRPIMFEQGGRGGASFRAASDGALRPACHFGRPRAASQRCLKSVWLAPGHIGNTPNPMSRRKVT